MKCFFCGSIAPVVQSPLDIPEQPPDIWRAMCSTPGCVSKYDFEGSLRGMALDAKNLADLKSQLEKRDQEAVPAVLHWYKVEVIFWPPD